MAAPGETSSNSTTTTTSPITTPITTTPITPITTTSTTSTPITTSTTSTTPTTSTSSTSTTSSTSPTTSTSSTFLTSSSFTFSSSSISPSLSTSTTVVSPSDGRPPTTIIQTVTTNFSPTTVPDTATSAATSSTSSASAIGSTGGQSGGSSNPSPSTVAPAVIVPVVGIALAIVLGIFFWRRRKQRQEAAEMRQKEMEEYSYNPNSDPTIPVVGAVSSNGDDHSGEGGGYRGWGTTSSSGPRKASTTLGGASTLPGTSSPGAIGIARSDSGGRGYDDYHALSPEHDGAVMSGGHDGVGALGAGPLASNNKNQGVNRGISNASSAYSGGQRSDGSDNAPGFGASPHQYYDELLQPDEGAHDGYGPPVIRDVSARRNTRIENPAIYPQQGNAGIAQNF